MWCEHFLIECCGSRNIKNNNKHKFDFDRNYNICRNILKKKLRNIAIFMK